MYNFSLYISVPTGRTQTVRTARRSASGSVAIASFDANNGIWKRDGQGEGGKVATSQMGVRERPRGLRARMRKRGLSCLWRVARELWTRQGCAGTRIGNVCAFTSRSSCLIGFTHGPAQSGADFEYAMFLMEHLWDVKS